MNKKGFISMTIIYTFLLLLIFTLLTMILLYSQKTKIIDALVEGGKKNIGNIVNNKPTEDYYYRMYSN